MGICYNIKSWGGSVTNDGIKGKKRKKNEKKERMWESEKREKEEEKKVREAIIGSQESHLIN